jgi:hypothetical protein
MSAKEILSKILDSTKADVSYKTKTGATVIVSGKQMLTKLESLNALGLYGNQMPGYLSGYVDNQGGTKFVTEQDPLDPVTVVEVGKDQYSERHNIGCVVLAAMVSGELLGGTLGELTSQTKVVVKEDDE